MKTDSITHTGNKEILLMTTTTFSNRQLCEINSQEGNRYVAPAEQLEAACWNGLLDELLPEIMNQSPDDKKLFIWQVEMRKFYLWINKANCPPVQEIRSALDPHVFLCRQEMN